ncbi:hypothetical protein KR222_000612 [Zaprionus bogoriensis]|nr:hypothetical protein KR222_000612 [Zaprionus bogoriensis]
MSNLSNASQSQSLPPPLPPRRLAPGSATPVTVTRPPAAAPSSAPAATAVLTARLSGANTVTSSVVTLDRTLPTPHSPPPPPAAAATAPITPHTAATSCPDSPIRRVSSSLKNSALDFASRFFNKCKAATFTVDGATYTIGE